MYSAREISSEHNKIIADFRSDTVTRPSDAMKDAMMSAPLGMMFMVMIPPPMRWKKKQQKCWVRMPLFLCPQERSLIWRE